MSDLHRVADVIANAISLGGDPLDVARELAKRGMLAYNRTVDVVPAAIRTTNYFIQASEAAELEPRLRQQIETSVRRTGGRIME